MMTQHTPPESLQHLPPPEQLRAELGALVRQASLVRRLLRVSQAAAKEQSPASTKAGQGATR